MPYGNNTIIISNSPTTSYDLTIYDDDWKELFYIPSTNSGEVITFMYNNTSVDSIPLIFELNSENGVGDAVIEIQNPNELPPKKNINSFDLIISLILIISSSVAIFHLSNRRRKRLLPRYTFNI